MVKTAGEKIFNGKLLVQEYVSKQVRKEFVKEKRMLVAQHEKELKDITDQHKVEILRLKEELELQNAALQQLSGISVAASQAASEASELNAVEVSSTSSTEHSGKDSGLSSQTNLAASSVSSLEDSLPTDVEDNLPKDVVDNIPVSQASAGGIAPAAEDKGGNAPAAEDEGGNAPAAEDEGGNAPAAEDEGLNAPAAEDEGLNAPPAEDEGLNATEDNGGAGLRFIPSDCICFHEKIGHGQFGSVYRADWYADFETVNVAVKTINSSSREEVTNEIIIMANCIHGNIIPLCGVSATGSSFMMIMPLMQFSLKDMLGKKAGFPNGMTYKTILVDIAQGMAHVASLGYVHRDLAARNIMIDFDNTCKIADFGLASEFQHLPTPVCGHFPLRWMALESIFHGIFTEKSDVWSYGVTVWEVFTGGDLPYKSAKAKSLPDLLVSGQRLHCPPGCPKEIYTVMGTCWREESNSRPTFQQIQTFLHNFTFPTEVHYHMYHNLTYKVADNPLYQSISLH